MENRREIIKKFFESDSRLDLLTLFLYALSQLDGGINSLEYSITIKIVPTLQQFKILCHKLDQEMKFQISVKIMTLILIILTFAHTQATIFVKIGLYEIQQQENSWIYLIEDHPTNSQIYITSLYWSMITMVTIGYGDIHPVTSMEMVFVSVVSLIACGIYGYSFNQIGQIVDSYEKQTDEFNKEMQVLNRQMNQRQLNKSLQHQVRKYFEYLRKEEQIDDEKANQMISNLPSSMKQSIIFDINNRILMSQKVFSLNFSQQFLNKLSMEMKTLTLGPEIDLYNEIDNDDKVYFILKGEVEIYINLGNKQKTGYILKKGNMFGEIEFLCKQKRLKAAKTVNVVTLLYINYQDFIRCISNFSLDFEKYSMIKDNVLLYNDLTGLDRRCLSCKKYNHQYVECPQLQYSPNFNKIISAANQSYFQERGAFNNRTQRRISFFQNMSVYQDAWKRYIFDQKQWYEENYEGDNNSGSDAENSSQKREKTFSNPFARMNSATYQANIEDLIPQEVPSQTNININFPTTPTKGRNKTINGFESESNKRCDFKRNNSHKHTQISKKGIMNHNPQGEEDYCSPSRRAFKRHYNEISFADIPGSSGQLNQNTSPNNKVQMPQILEELSQSSFSYLANQQMAGLHVPISLYKAQSQKETFLNQSGYQRSLSLNSPTHSNGQQRSTIQPSQFQQYQQIPNFQQSQQQNFQQYQQQNQQQQHFHHQGSSHCLKQLSFSQQQTYGQQHSSGYADGALPISKHHVEFEHAKTLSKMDHHNVNKGKSNVDIFLSGHSKDQFEICKIYRFYFTHNNIGNVLRQLPTSQIGRKKKRNHRL